MSRVPAGTCLSLIVAAALAATGCGGDDSSSTSTTDDGAPTAEATQACLQKAGVDVRSEQPTSDDMVATLFINEDQFDQVYLAFMDNAAAAQKIVKGLGGLASQAGGNAGGRVVDETVVLATARDTTQAQVDQVEGCLTG
jgi:hypothetical protein